jgi:1-aminocyclopropane-1-carboxylate deaminase/D-cysteine desulfhydrase-like pyridoxal-dependent ACC family enzyme
VSALLDRYPRLADVVPYTPLADGLPTPVDRLADGLWVQRDDRTDSRYGGNKIRKLEHLLAVAARRGGPVLTAGAIGSHHVVACAVHGARVGVSVEAVRFPQPVTPHVEEVAAHAAALGVVDHHAGSSTAMPFVLAARWARLAGRGATLVVPGGSTPIGILGAVGGGIELATSGIEEPDDIVCALGSGGTTVGLALGIALAGWRRATVVGVLVSEAIVGNRVVLGGLEAGTRALLATGGVFAPPARWSIDTEYLGEGYGFPTDAGTDAAALAAGLGVATDPTYTAKGFAAALARVAAGRRVVYVDTLAAE